jgi:hypothetical protein
MDPEPVTVVPMQNELQVIRSAGRQAISTFLEAHTCFSVLRASGKVVVFDTRIPVQLAFYALVEHGKKILVDEIVEDASSVGQTVVRSVKCLPS